MRSARQPIRVSGWGLVERSRSAPQQHRNSATAAALAGQRGDLGIGGGRRKASIASSSQESRSQEQPPALIRISPVLPGPSPSRHARSSPGGVLTRFVFLQKTAQGGNTLFHVPDRLGRIERGSARKAGADSSAGNVAQELVVLAGQIRSACFCRPPLRPRNANLGARQETAQMS